MSCRSSPDLRSGAQPGRTMEPAEDHECDGEQQDQWGEGRDDPDNGSRSQRVTARDTDLNGSSDIRLRPQGDLTERGLAYAINAVVASVRGRHKEGVAAEIQACRLLLIDDLRDRREVR